MILKLFIICWGGLHSLSSLAAVGAGRVIYLNGVDISSAKNQSLEQVNIRIDAQGHIYIEASQYEVQQDTTFVPLSRQMPLHPNLPEHKIPGPMSKQVEAPASKQELASPPETGDTMVEAEGMNHHDAVPKAKEGTRKLPDGNGNLSKDGITPPIPAAQRADP